MSSFALGHYAYGVSAACALLAACSGPQQLIATPGARPDGNALAHRTTQFISPTFKLDAERPGYSASGPLLYVTNFDSPPYDGVTIYEAKQKDDPDPIAVIDDDVSDPGGDCIDAGGTLYVMNQPVSGSGWVSEYALGSTKPTRIVSEGIRTPAFCAIDGHGNLWVTNFGGPNVTEYLKGSSVPHEILTNGLTAPDGIAIDGRGNIYVGNLQPYGTSTVQVFSPGRKTPSRTITDGLTWPIGIAVDASGTLYVANWLQCNIEKYRRGQNHPYQTITNDIAGPVALAFSKAGRMYVVNEGASGCAGPAPAVLEFPPHTLSPSKRLINKDMHVPAGVTYYPPLLP